MSGLFVARARFSVVLVVTALALGGCGQSEEDAARAVAQKFITELADGDASACDHLTKYGQLSIALNSIDPSSGDIPQAQDCQTNFSTLTRRKDFSALHTADVKKVRIDGDKAYVTTDAAELPSLTLVKERGAWKVNDFGT